MNKKIIVEHHLFVRWVPELSTIAVYDGDNPDANDCFIEGTFWDDDLPRWMTQLLENIDPGFRIPVEGFVKFSTIEKRDEFMKYAEEIAYADGELKEYLEDYAE